MRTTIYLDEELNCRLRRLVPGRGLNQFIRDALVEKIEALERQQIEREMMEGYIARDREQAEVIRDWEALDTVDWPA